ncbi:MAG TPA: nucleotidyltransferase domain-containing protein [Minicystis sp.]|nr:nucleotidyltransferase domain-containing protein [Minicystis sp.]
MEDDALLGVLAAELARAHGCHTVIVYGSRARGDATAGSDWDLAGIRAEAPRLRDARRVHGALLDAFVYPDAAIDELGPELLKLTGGRVVFEQGGAGARWLARAAEIEARGPEPLPPDEEAAIRAWVPKMLARAARGDVEGDFRRAWLVVQLLDDYFRLRGRFYRGPKESLAWLAVNDPPVRAAFERALAPGAPLAAIAALAALVLEETAKLGP